MVGDGSDAGTGSPISQTSKSLSRVFAPRRVTGHLKHLIAPSFRTGSRFDPFDASSCRALAIKTWLVFPGGVCAKLGEKTRRWQNVCLTAHFR